MRQKRGPYNRGYLAVLRFFAEAGKHDSRNPKNNLQLILLFLLFLDHGRLNSQLLWAFFTARIQDDRNPKIAKNRGSLMDRGCRETLFGAYIPVPHGTAAGRNQVAVTPPYTCDYTVPQKSRNSFFSLFSLFKLNHLNVTLSYRKDSPPIQNLFQKFHLL